MDVIRKVAKVPVDMSDRPKIPVIIVNCGELNDPRNFLIVRNFHYLLFDSMTHLKNKYSMKYKNKKKSFMGRKKKMKTEIK